MSYTIPIGPYHPSLEEPVHARLTVDGEMITDAKVFIGYNHRGIEKLAQERNFIQTDVLVERVCGICSHSHAMTYAMCVENIAGMEVPKRGQYIRVIISELERIHSHLLWLGLLADAFGFESLFYQCWRMREKILDLFELTTGGRCIFSVNKIGGVLKDIDEEMMSTILGVMDEMEQDMKAIIKTFLSDYTVESRLKGVGVLTKQQAHDLGAAGPFARASGIAMDMRKRGYAAYPHIDFEPITSDIGDSYARCDVRIHEVLQSIDIIRQAAAKMPKGEIGVNVKGNPNGEYFMRVEQPRGEAIYYVKANGTKFLDRMRVRTPTFANLPGMLETLKGADLADVALLVLTIDPCISCTER